MNNIKDDLLIPFMLFIWTLLVITTIFLQYRKIDGEWQFDLRGRIVGTRVMSDGGDPYIYKYSKSMQDRYIDPLSIPNFTRSRVTVPPSLLIMHLWIARYSYLDILSYWFVIQWVLIGMTILIFVKIANQSITKKVVYLVGMFFASSSIWYSNIVVGQIYILYDFILALILWSKYKSRHPFIVPGLLIGILAALRPTFLLLIPTSIFYNRKTFIASLLGLVLSVALTFVITGPKPWAGYIDSVKVMSNAQLYKGGLDLSEYYPRKIEGLVLPSNISETIHDSSVKRFITLKTGSTPSAIMLVGSLIVTVIVVTAFAIKNKVFGSFDAYLLVNLCLIFTVEHLIPVGRYLYYNIQWLIPILIIVLIIDRYPTKNVLKISHLLVIGLTLLLVFVVPLLSIIYSTVLLWLFSLTMLFVSFRLVLGNSNELRNC